MRFDHIGMYSYSVDVNEGKDRGKCVGIFEY